ncbi:deoxynucleoside kinase [Mycoplasmopsis gallinacea]|uniref:Deoxynucleoside kinase n=1 Tax=Mycoplasmopsis gallinacea TaxID=29556 RepID=A0A6H0V6T8_9BACT|nr:deoxynucleoside kinase [Mycoplasmopsis gallinacea]QIW62693.1 deoxynucleoside kinase [Mycoplasmopsis gallinacea]
MIVAVSGMISSGKSTLVKQLAQKCGVNNLILDEYDPKDFVFENLLSWFLQHKPNVGLSFDIYVIDSHVERVHQIREKMVKNNLENSFIFLDRFPLEHCIFAFVDFGYIQDKKYLQVYKAGLNELITPESLPDFVIYLDMDFETFKKRLFKRNRPAEVNNWSKNITYWEKLHSIYKKEFIKMCEEFNVQYQIIDTNGKSEEEVFLQAQKIINDVKIQRGKNENSN